MSNTVDIKMGLNDKAVKSGLDSLRKEIGKFREQTSMDIQGGIFRGMHYLNGAVGLVRTALGGLKGMVDSVFEPSSNLENLTVQMGTVLGSAEEAARTIDDIRKLASKTPFELSDLAPAAVGLINADIKGQKMIDTLTMLGDVASGAQQPLNEVVRIYAKIIGGGRMQTDELNQLVERQINVSALADMFGGMQNLRKELEKGNVSAGKVTEAFQKMTGSGGMYFKAMEAQSRTFTGKLSTLSDAWTALKTSLGTPIMNALKPLIDFITSKVESFNTAAKAAGEAIAGWVTYFVRAVEAGNGMDALWNGIQQGAIKTGIVIRDAVGKAVDAVIAQFPKLGKAFEAVSAIGRGVEWAGEKAAEGAVRAVAWVGSKAGMDQASKDMIEALESGKANPDKSLTLEGKLDQLKREQGAMEKQFKPQAEAPSLMETDEQKFDRGVYEWATNRLAEMEKERQDEIDKQWDAAGLRVDAAQKQVEQMMGVQRIGIADSMQRIGGGGVAFTRIVDPVKETAKNTKKANDLLDKILNKEGATWQP